MAINERQKWPTNKDKYDKNYLRLYGKPCTMCNGKAKGIPHKGGGWVTCPQCKGLGKVVR